MIDMNSLPLLPTINITRNVYGDILEHLVLLIYPTYRDGNIGVYYSYGSPLTVSGKNKIIVRQDYMSRSVGVRSTEHYQYIAIFIRIAEATNKSITRINTLKDEEFFSQVKDLFASCGIVCNYTDVNTVNKQSVASRRVII